MPDPRDREREGDDRSGSPGESNRVRPPNAATRARDHDIAAREDLQRLVGLIESIEREVPEPYRVEAFRLLGRRPPSTSAARREPRGRGPAVDTARSALRADPIRSRLNLTEYAGLLSAPGRTLLKALVALDVTASQLGVDWMSPSEIERFLVDRAGVPHVYRTNVSNALRGARPLADRRRRGRGYEYRITLAGREALEREQKILGG